MAKAPDLLVARPQGLYCPAGDFYIDPSRPVHRAVLTHAHADHARAGHRHVLATAVSEGVLRSRLGAQLPLQGLAYGQRLVHQGVQISLHPAGHVLGSAQVRLAHGGHVWVASGDYFLSEHDERNPTCEPFEPVPCDTFITESTFGLPVYRWPAQARVFAQINAWWRANAAVGRISLLLAYSFGKAQRLLTGLDPQAGAVLVHRAVAPINQAYRAAGVALPATHTLGELPDVAAWPGALVVAPPSVLGSAWARALGEHRSAFASGWMQLRAGRRRQRADAGFVLSDHADWPGLQRAIRASRAERIIVTHGQEAVMVRWLAEQGLDAGVLRPEPAAAAPADVPGPAPADLQPAPAPGAAD